MSCTYVYILFAEKCYFLLNYKYSEINAKIPHELYFYSHATGRIAGMEPKHNQVV